MDCVVGGAGEATPLGVGDAVLRGAGVDVKVALPYVFGLSRAFGFHFSLQLASRFLRLPAITVFCALDQGRIGRSCVKGG